MKKRTTEESRAYMRRYRARQRGVTPAEQGVTPPDKTSHKTSSDMSIEDRWREGLHDITVGGSKPAFLAAPDDDCAACGHDRQTVHIEKCRICGCPEFVAVEEPF